LMMQLAFPNYITIIKTKNNNATTALVHDLPPQRKSKWP
jgi:hypothetical protein